VLENEEIEGLSSSAQLTIERRGLDPWTIPLCHEIASNKGKVVFDEIRKVFRFSKSSGR
jgi:hypothetical protein